MAGGYVCLLVRLAPIQLGTFPMANYWATHLAFLDLSIPSPNPLNSLRMLDRHLKYWVACMTGVRQLGG